MIALIMLALTLMQGGFYNGTAETPLEGLYLADCNVQGFVKDSKIDNCTGEINVLEKVAATRFRGNVSVVNGTLNLTLSEANVYCENATVYALKSVLNLSLKNCTLFASLNEIRNFTVLDDVKEFSKMMNLPLQFSYGNQSFWKWPGNKWSGFELLGDVIDNDGDGLSDDMVCPIYTIKGWNGSLLCEKIVIGSIEDFAVHGIEKPPLSIYEATESGLKYVGPLVEEESLENAPGVSEIAILIAGVVLGVALVLWIARKPLPPRQRKGF